MPTDRTEQTQCEDRPTVRYRVVWGLGRYEEFGSPHEAGERADEIHREMVEDWPLLAGTGDGALPRGQKCSRCGGSGEEPITDDDQYRGHVVCDRCEGTGVDPDPPNTRQAD